MNKILLSTLFLLSPALINANVYEALQRFNMAKGQYANECMELKKMCIDEKIALKKQQLHECLALKDQFIARVKSEGCSDQMWKEKLAQEIALCEKHMMEKTALCDKHHMAEVALHTKGRMKLAEFKALLKVGSMMNRLGGQPMMMSSQSMMS